MDLRGLGPDDVYALMKGGLGLKEIEGNNANREAQRGLTEQQIRAAQAQHQVDNYYKQQKLGLDISGENRQLSELQMKQAGLHPSTPINVNGKMVQQYHDVYGNLKHQAILGDAPTKGEHSKLLVDKEGTPFWAKPGEALPAGARYLASADNGYSIPNQVELASLKGIIETGTDAKKQDYDEPTRDSFMQVVNANDKVQQYVKIPGKASNWGNLEGKRDAQWVKLPKSYTQLSSMPPNTPISADDKTGNVITLQMAKDLATSKSVPLETVLKYFNIQTSK